jgi:hypothetical protein
MYAAVGGFMFHTPNENVLIKTPKEALEKLKSLRSSGYEGLDWAIDRLEWEIEEGQYVPNVDL